MILDCCTLQRDCRGNVMDFETTERSARYCGNGPTGTRRAAREFLRLSGRPSVYLGDDGRDGRGSDVER